jgi:hypothetical protein
MAENINLADPNSVSTPTTQLSRIKYFPIEMTAVGLKPLTNYDVFYNGQEVDAFCKPFGGVLGQQLISDATGQLLFQFHLGIQYTQIYLVNNDGSKSQSNSSSLSQQNASLQLVDPAGITITTYIPIHLKM